MLSGSTPSIAILRPDLRNSSSSFSTSDSSERMPSPGLLAQFAHEFHDLGRGLRLVKKNFLQYPPIC